MSLSIKDSKIILRVIQSGSFPMLIDLSVNLDSITNSQLISILKDSDTKKYNYLLAEKLVNQLSTENSNLKKNITRLIAIELNYYQDKSQRDKIYSQLNNLISNLIPFSEKKRIVKFLVKFTKTSKALQSIVKDNKNIEMLKIYKLINSEVK